MFTVKFLELKKKKELLEKTEYETLEKKCKLLSVELCKKQCHSRHVY